MRGIIYAPRGKGPFPALIVIHEWWVLNDWVKEQAAKLADQGYVALAVDLSRGRVASDSGEAHELSRGLSEDRAKRDLDAAFHYLEAQANVEKTKSAPLAGALSRVQHYPERSAGWYTVLRQKWGSGEYPDKNRFP